LPYAGTVLKEIRLQLILAMMRQAVEETAQHESISPVKIWMNVGKLAKKRGATRQELWT
jgi:hypothetical protein